MLDGALDIFRLRQYFNALLTGRDVGAGLLGDAAFLNTVRRAVAPLPFERTVPADLTPFRAPEPLQLDALRRRRVALLASGGSGALASVTGAWRALEEADITPAVVSVCSGSATFGFALAAGHPAARVAEAVLSMQVRDFVDADWRGAALSVLRAGRGFGGLVKGSRLEAAYGELVGDMTLGELPIPCYAPIWNIEENRVEYIGPRTHPDLSVVRAIRVAIAIPLFFDPVPINGSHWCDGGIVDIFPVRPILDIEPPVDAVLGVNGFYPAGFVGEDAAGWRERSGSILRIASQVRTAQQIELARENVRRLEQASVLRMIEPVPYEVVRGTGFYRQFLDRSDWPAFMRDGRTEARRALVELDAAVRGRGTSRARPARRRASRRASGDRPPARSERAGASAARRRRRGRAGP